MTLTSFPATLRDPVETRTGLSDHCPVPSHGRGRGDVNRSLDIKRGRRCHLVLCRAGCSLEEITAAWGIKVCDLFYDAPSSHSPRTRPTPQPAKVDRVAIAFRYDLAALDLQVRATRTIEAGKHLAVVTMTDDELDTALSCVGAAYDDCERAEVFEHIVDDLRMKAYLARDHEQPRRIA